MMNKERLLLLKTMLTEVAAGDWNITVPAPLLKTRVLRASVFGNVEFDLDSWICKKDSGDCGFSACAVGHLVLDKRFADLGWSFDGQIPVYRPEDRDFDIGNWEAVEYFFDVSTKTAERLFSGWEYRGENGDLIKATPQDVINRIDLLLTHGYIDFNSIIEAENNAKRELQRLATKAILETQE